MPLFKALVLKSIHSSSEEVYSVALANMDSFLLYFSTFIYVIKDAGLELPILKSYMDTNLLD